MPWFSARAVSFALNRYLAVILALYVAFSLDLPNPWWAMVTVFLGQPPQPLVGAIWAKAIYRVLGTLLGLVASLVIIPNLSDMPELMILALGAWVGLCLYIALLDRTPRAYVFMLSGYTAAIVGLPSAVNPVGIFDVSVARTEEIIIGVLASAIVQSVLFPRSVSAALHDRLDVVLNDARKWIGDGLRALSAPDAAAPSRRIAIDLTDMSLMATDMRFEGGFPGSARLLLGALEERLVALLPLVSAIEDRLRTLAAEEPAAATLAPLMERVAIWVARAHLPGGEQAGQLTREIEALMPELGPGSSWADMLVASLASRLAELITSWERCLALRAALREPARRSSPSDQRLLEGHRRPRLLHVDHGIALFSALVAAFTVISGGALTIAVRWEGGAIAIGIAAVCCSLFAALDDPTPQVWNFLVGFIIGLPLAILYEFAILPAIDGFAMLAAVLFPVIFLIGIFLTQPRYIPRGLSTAVGFTAGLALQPTFLSDFATFMNAYVALAVGTLLGLVGLSLLRVIPVHHAIRRILRAGWRDLAGLTAAASVPSRAAWAGRMLDRVGLLIPRLAQAAPSEEWELVDALRDLRLGVGIIELRHLNDAAREPADRQGIETILAILGRHFRALATGRRTALPAGVVEALDAVMARFLHMARPEDRHAGIVAAVGLRRGLFPRAPAYQPMPGAE